MAAVLNFSGIKSEDDLTTELKKIASDPDYAWLKPIVSVSTTEYVKGKLPNPLAKDVYLPTLVERNIDAAGYVLDNSLAKLREIQDLEVEAIRIALDLQLETQLQPYEKEFLRVQHKGNLSAAGENSTNDRTIEDRDDLISHARRTRIELHLSQGGALNYGERVNELRDLLASNIEMAYERMYAVWIGLNASYGIAVNEPPPWDNPSSLGDLVQWLRSASRKLEAGARSETIYEHYFLLGADGIANVNPILGNGPAVIRFKLKPDNFPGYSPGMRLRVVGIGATLLYSDVNIKFNEVMALEPKDREVFNTIYGYASKQRESISVSMRIDLPAQKVDLPGLSDHEKVWTPKPLRLTGMPVWSSDSLSESLAIKSDEVYSNLDPSGEWEIEVDAHVNSSSGRIPRESAGAGIPQTITNFAAYVPPKDVVLAFKVAIR